MSGFVNSPWRLGTVHTVTTSGTSASSAAVGNYTWAVLLTVKTGDCHVAIGQSPTATTSDLLIKVTDHPLPIACSPGDKVAVIDDGTAGILYVAELTH